MSNKTDILMDNFDLFMHEKLLGNFLMQEYLKTLTPKERISVQKRLTKNNITSDYEFIVNLSKRLIYKSLIEKITRE